MNRAETIVWEGLRINGNIKMGQTSLQTAFFYCLEHVQKINKKKQNNFFLLKNIYESCLLHKAVCIESIMFVF